MGAQRITQMNYLLQIFPNFSERRKREVRSKPGPMGEKFSGNCNVASRNALLHNGATNATWSPRFGSEVVLPWRSGALAAELGGTLATPNFREFPLAEVRG
jgi:hypothetical protein